MVWASRYSTPSSPSNLRNLTWVLASQGRRYFSVRTARKELPARRVAPAGHHALVGFIEGVLQVLQHDHDAQRHARASGVAGNGDTLDLSAKKIRSGMTTPARHLLENTGATRASISCQGMREANTDSGWRRSIMWSMRERKKSSVAGQVNITAELPEINPYWRSNRAFCASKITPEAIICADPRDSSRAPN